MTVHAPIRGTIHPSTWARPVVCADRVEDEYNMHDAWQFIGTTARLMHRERLRPLLNCHTLEDMIALKLEGPDVDLLRRFWRYVGDARAALIEGDAVFMGMIAHSRCGRRRGRMGARARHGMGGGNGT